MSPRIAQASHHMDQLASLHCPVNIHKHIAMKEESKWTTLKVIVGFITYDIKLALYKNVHSLRCSQFKTY